MNRQTNFEDLYNGPEAPIYGVTNYPYIPRIQTPQQEDDLLQHIIPRHPDIQETYERYDWTQEHPEWEALRGVTDETP